MQHETVYRVYLLRLRQIGTSSESASNEILWRITLEEAGSGQETLFPTLDALLIYLTSSLQAVASTCNEEEESHE